ncbi:MAG: nucleoside hydrolase [Thermoguttaceae bacterium]|nr:nucleoside hydrolase [Thermoguttaceae bacterium]
MRKLLSALLLFGLLLTAPFAVGKPPIPIIFDTDMGNDADDAMALAILNAFVDRGECDLLAVTLTKTSPNAAPYIKMFNAYMGHPDIPIGITSEERTPSDGKYLAAIFDLKKADGTPLFPKPKITPEPAVPLIRKCLAAAEDGSVVIIQVGFSTNLAELLESPADDVSPLTGRELVKRKVRLLSTMFGAFNGRYQGEFNVLNDVPAARKVAAEWPTPIWFSGFEIGEAVTISREQMEAAFGADSDHPMMHTFTLYREGWDGGQPTFDVTSVLLAIRPDEGYFTLSPKGKARVNGDDVTLFEEKPEGNHQYIVEVTPAQNVRVQEAFLYLMSQPPLR